MSPIPGGKRIYKYFHYFHDKRQEDRFMKCPVCDVNLNMTERQGVEIDYCPQCRGVWLDRGELDKIIERSAGAAPSPPPANPPAARPVPPARPPEYRDAEEYGSRPDYPKKDREKKSFLSELFDFGD